MVGMSPKSKKLAMNMNAPAQIHTESQSCLVPQVLMVIIKYASSKTMMMDANLNGGKTMITNWTRLDSMTSIL
jgi:hypothetical protein